MTHRKTNRILLLIAALSAAPGAARAQSNDSAAAQSLFDQAKTLMAAGHYSEACPKLQESERLDPHGGTLLNLARCYEETQRLASAWSTYIEAATAAKTSKNAERESAARQRAAALAPRLSKLVITVAPALASVPGLEITRDGVAVGEPAWGVPLPSDGGEHTVVAKAPRFQTFSTRATVATEGQTTSVTVPELSPQPKASTTPAGEGPSPDAGPEEVHHQQWSPKSGLGSTRVAALVVGGVGVIGVGLGTAFGLISKSKHDKAAQDCAAPACSSEQGVELANQAQSNGNISTVMMVIGGVGLATGVTLWLAAPSSSGASSTAQLSLGFGTLQAKASF